MAKTEDAKSKKRKFSRSAHGNPNKRRKGNANAKTSQPAAKPRRIVAASELKWKPVAIPEMFDDAEGFFGLEEIEGVEIVRDGENVQFVTTAPAESDDFEGFGDAPDEASTGDQETNETPGAKTVNGDKVTAEKLAKKKNEIPKSKERTDEQKAEDKKDRTKQEKKQKDEREGGKKDQKNDQEKDQMKAQKKDQKKDQKSDQKKDRKKDQKSDQRNDQKNDQKKDGKKDGKKDQGESAADDELGGGGFAMLTEISSDAEDDGADVSAWVPLDLSPPLVSCLARLKFSKPTAIQAASIPEILAGHDVIGKASTGSGKTLAFSIPIVERWLSLNNSSSAAKKTADSTKAGESTKTPLALILSPTRELAHQITNHIKELCAALPTSPYVCSVTGGLSVHKQQRQLEKADIVVGTPGRLWEVLSASRPLLDAFRSISFLVVDEADRLLSDGHFKEAEEILLALDRQEMDEQEEEDDDEESGPKQRPRQTLVYSATFNKGLQQKLAGKSRYDLMDKAQSMEHLLKRLNFREEVPKFIDVNPVSQMAERLREGLIQCDAMEKDLYLYATLLLQPTTRRTLVFTNSISSVRRLTPMLQNLNLPALALHSQMPQKARLRSVERFTAAQNSRGAVLIATDVAARGLDIPGINTVIHYHVPRTADNYVHRSGRTARASSAGTSVLLCGPGEVIPTRRLVAKIHAAALAKKDGQSSSSSGGGNGSGNGNGSSNGTSFFIRTIDIDRRLVSRLRDRLDLAKTLADAALAKEKGNKDSNWLREAAEELGVDYDSDDEEALEKAGSWSGRGSGRRSKEKEARELSKAEMGVLRAKLRQELSKRVNTGVSERYITGGTVDVDELLRGGGTGDFLGKVDGLGLDD